MTEHGNIYTHAIVEVLPPPPSPLPGPVGPIMGTPTASQLAAYYRATGWRRIVSREAPSPGYRIVSIRIEEINGDTCNVCVDGQVNIAAEQAAAASTAAAADLAAREARALDAGDQLLATVLVNVINLRLAVDKKISKAELVAEARKQLGLT